MCDNYTSHCTLTVFLDRFRGWKKAILCFAVYFCLSFRLRRHPDALFFCRDKVFVESSANLEASVVYISPEEPKSSETTKYIKFPYRKIAYMGLYNFIRGLEWAYKREGWGHISGGHISGIKNMFPNDEMKRI